MNSGALEKLTIRSFEFPETLQLGASLNEFQAQFNPESFSINMAHEYGPKKQVHGETSTEPKFKGMKARTFSFELLLDGTGASGGEKQEVALQIEQFRKTVGYLGKIHRPTYLVVSWGKYFVATCVLESFSINYKLFRPDGTPLRATVSISFKEHIPKALDELIHQKSSPDLTHSLLIRDGDHLALTAYRIYKDTRYYLQVADYNELNNVRRLKAGQVLHFPPVK